MQRNLLRRVEHLVPIENPTVHRQVLDQIMVANLKDRTNSWVLTSEGQYERVPHSDDDFSAHRSEEHTSELQSLMRISYAVFCLKKKRKKRLQTSIQTPCTRVESREHKRQCNNQRRSSYRFQ